MNLKDIKKIYNLYDDLFNILTDYSFSLNKYFNNEKNIREHEELYNEYKILLQNLHSLKGKYKL